MDRNTSDPLTPEEAKARLRAAALQVNLTTWKRRRAWRVLGVALVGGFIVGRLRISTTTTVLLIRQITPTLLATLLQKRRDGKKRCGR